MLSLRKSRGGSASAEKLSAGERVARRPNCEAPYLRFAVLVLIDQVLGDLDGVERGPLAQIVGDDP